MSERFVTISARRGLNMQLENQMKNGFSLLELLIVVAIIGVLAAAGVVGYQTYTDTAKENTARGDAASIAKIIATDTHAITSKLGAQSRFTENLTEDSTCLELVDSLVEEINVGQGKRSQYQDCPLAFNGHYTYNIASGGKEVGNHSDYTHCEIEPFGNINNRVIRPARGRLMIACQGASGASGKLNSVNDSPDKGLKIYTCLCESDNCQTVRTSAPTPTQCVQPDQP